MPIEIARTKMQAGSLGSRDQRKPKDAQSVAPYFADCCCAVLRSASIYVSTAMADFEELRRQEYREREEGQAMISRFTKEPTYRP